MNIIRKTPVVTPLIESIEIECAAIADDTMKIDQIIRFTRDGVIEPGCQFTVIEGSRASAIYVKREHALALATALNEIFG